MQKLKTVLAVLALTLVSTGCSRDRSAHTQLAGDGRVSLIKMKGECYLLYHAGFGRGITRTSCPKGREYVYGLDQMENK